MKLITNPQEGTMLIEPTSQPELEAFVHQYGLEKEGDQLVFRRKDIDIVDDEKGLQKSFVLVTSSMPPVLTPPKTPPVLDPVEIVEGEED